MEATAEQRDAAEAAWLQGWIEGPKHLRWMDLPLQVGGAAPDLTLKTAADEAIQLSTCWKHGPAILIFLRHFGCGCAWERAELLKGEYSALTAAGASVVAIGQSDPARARDFAAQSGLPCPLLCDPTRSAYRAFNILEATPSQVVYGMGEGFLRRDPDVGRAFAASRKGSLRSPVDSPWQLPGEFVVDGSGVIRLAYRSQYCADYANPDVLVAAITEAVLEL